MAKTTNTYVTDMKIFQRENATTESALAALEQGIFKGYSAHDKHASPHHDKDHGPANDVAQDTLRYLFAIFN